jgi:hypothetical protein
VPAVAATLPTQLSTVDGKTVRRSHDRHTGKAALHLVSAWASANRLVLAQTAVADKANEMVAIPDLLRALTGGPGAGSPWIPWAASPPSLSRSYDQGGDYVLALKDNQPTLTAAVQECLVQAQRTGCAEVAHDADTEVPKGHGRLAVRWRW